MTDAKRWLKAVGEKEHLAMRRSEKEAARDEAVRPGPGLFASPWRACSQTLRAKTTLK